MLYLDINISFDFFGFCDRCAEKVKKHFSFDVKRIVVEKLENEEDDDDYIVVSNRELDLDELVNEKFRSHCLTRFFVKRIARAYVRNAALI